jgi:hypothetical protein
VVRLRSRSSARASVESSRLLPDIPTSDQHRSRRVSRIRPNDYLEISASYRFLAAVELDQVALPPTGAVVLNGDYSPAWANQAGVGMRVKL